MISLLNNLKKRTDTSSTVNSAIVSFTSLALNSLEVESSTNTSPKALCTELGSQQCAIRSGASIATNTVIEIGRCNKMFYLHNEE